MSLDLEHSIFPHQCTQQGCDRTVQYDDEPWCFTHSPDEGSHVTGWSSRRLAIEAAWRTYWDADRKMTDFADRTDDAGSTIHDHYRNLHIAARAELERLWQFGESRHSRSPASRSHRHGDGTMRHSRLSQRDARRIARSSRSG